MTTASAASVADHSVDPPQRHEADGSPTWITRGANFVVAITRAAAGCRLAVSNVPDEHMVLLPDAGATIAVGDASPLDVAGYRLVIVPPGDSAIVAAGSGYIVRCFSDRYAAMLALAGNAADYAAPRPDVAPLDPWPEPVGGFALRQYDLADALAPGDNNRCFRSTNLMINVLRERDAPRDPTKLSPHAHTDFEQGSIALAGTYVHHLRTPWTADQTRWRPDQAVSVGSPSVTVIPPTVIHTSRNTEAPALLVDLFCPPRRDFSLRPGMVRNADDYPLPAELA